MNTSGIFYPFKQTREFKQRSNLLGIRISKLYYHKMDPALSMVGTLRNNAMLIDNRGYSRKQPGLPTVAAPETYLIASIAIATGAHIRVEFEDGSFFPNVPMPKAMGSG